MNGMNLGTSTIRLAMVLKGSLFIIIRAISFRLSLSFFFLFGDMIVSKRVDRDSLSTGQIEIMPSAGQEPIVVGLAGFPLILLFPVVMGGF